MSYNPINWVNGETPINDTNLNNMDQGIVDAHSMLAEHERKINDFANQQLPEEYVKEAVDAYVENNSAGFATAAELAEAKSQLDSVDSEVDKLSGEIEELDNMTYDKLTSDNNFDSVFDESGYIDNSGNNADSSTFIRTSKFYPLNESISDTVYVYTSEQNATITVMLYAANYNYVNQIGCNNTDSNSKVVPSAKYFKAFTRNGYTGSLYVSRVEQVGAVDYSYTIEKVVKANNVDLSNVKNRTDKKVIVNFGDSMFGNYRGDTSISTYISELSGAIVYNCGFGGCQMSKRYLASVSEESNNAWSAFSMYSLAYAVCNNDFSLQEQYKNYGTTPANSLPDYFPEQLAILESIDFSKVDMITIAYGTNDYTAGKVIEDSEEEEFDVNTYIGALKYSVKQFQEKYPKIKILVITPIWRYFSDGTDSDVNNYGGTGTLLDYKDALVNACKKLRIPYLDSYENLSLSMYNKNTFFEDYTHLNASGRKWYAELIDGKIQTLY